LRIGLTDQYHVDVLTTPQAVSHETNISSVLTLYESLTSVTLPLYNMHTIVRALL
jgi:hypothetical protein